LYSTTRLANRSGSRIERDLFTAGGVRDSPRRKDILEAEVAGKRVSTRTVIYLDEPEVRADPREDLHEADRESSRERATRANGCWPRIVADDELREIMEAEMEL
jgi:hypothetical protein